MLGTRDDIRGVGPVSLRNGSGKTYIANAIIWCLTGHLIRFRRHPEAERTEFPCQVTHDDGSVTIHLMSAVKPVPHSNGDVPADGTGFDSKQVTAKLRIACSGAALPATWQGHRS